MDGKDGKIKTENYPENKITPEQLNNMIKAIK